MTEELVLHVPPAWFRSTAAAGAALRRGETTPRQLAEYCFERIARLDGTLQAWVETCAEEALDVADRCGRELEVGLDRGPLHGIPLGVKDIFDMVGLPTKAGSPIRPDVPAARDAAVVARLREAGAVLLGKTVTTEFACLDPPPTVNPWNVDRTPGGSSSGSAAALAAGMCLGALGSQTGGSLLRPAAFCGVCAFKPTYGLLPLAGVVPISKTLDHAGFLGRTAADLGTIHSVLADRPLLPPPPERAPRIGVPQGIFREEASPAVRDAFRAVLGDLKRRGAAVVAVPLPEEFAAIGAAHACLMAVEAAAYHRPYYPSRREEYGPRLQSLLDAGRGHTALEYFAALELRTAFREELHDLFRASGVDAWLTPSAPTTAPDRTTTGSPAFNAPWSFLGWPTAGARGGPAADGLPIGLQWIAPPGSDGRILRWAAWGEGAEESDD